MPALALAISVLTTGCLGFTIHQKYTNMFHDLPYPMCGLLIAWCTALLYGMIVIVTAGYMQVLLSRGLKTATNRVLFVVASVQFVIATIHVAVGLRQAIDGFFNSPDPTLYFADQGSAQHTAQTSLYITNNILADGVLVWRLYVVWNRNILSCIPFVMMTIGSGLSGYVDVTQVSALTKEGLVFSASVQRWALATWSLSIATQVSASLLIAWKVWRTHIGTVGPHRSQRSMAVVWIILESGAVLSLGHVFLLALYVQKTVAGALVIAMLGQLDTLVPTSILLRVATHPDLHRDTSNRPSQSRSWRSMMHRRGVSIEVNPVDVSLHKDAELYGMSKVSTPSIVHSASIDDQV